jgi:acetyltransferase-like isoleucine patch superfamily enzyme
MSVIVEIPVSLSRSRFHGSCEVGAFSYFNGCAEVFHTNIGRYCSIAPDVVIGAGEHPVNYFSTHPFACGGGGSRFKNSKFYDVIRARGGKAPNHKRTTIGSDVWIGTRAYISQGVNIGHGSIVAAGAVVTKDVAPYTIVGGVPAKQIGARFHMDAVAQFLDLSWWDYLLDQEVIEAVSWEHAEEALSHLLEMKSSGVLMPAVYKTKKVRSRWHRRLFF